MFHSAFLNDLQYTPHNLFSRKWSSSLFPSYLFLSLPTLLIFKYGGMVNLFDTTRRISIINILNSDDFDIHEEVPEADGTASGSEKLAHDLDSIHEEEDGIGWKGRYLQKFGEGNPDSPEGEWKQSWQQQTTIDCFFGKKFIKWVLISKNIWDKPS